MLSIVKMDVDSDVEILDDDIKSEVIDIDENTDEDKKALKCFNNVELIPIIYTTKLDDTFLGRTKCPVGLNPKEVTDRIIKETRPPLRNYPGPPKKSRKNKKRFNELAEKIRRIYRPSNVVRSKEDLEVYKFTIQIDINSVKSEVIDEPVVKQETRVDRQDEKVKLKDTCKYSELLKQCKPCRVLLPVLIGNGQVFHGGQVLKASRVPKPSGVSSSLSISSDDEIPLITLAPDLPVECNSSKRKYNKMKQENKSTTPDNLLRPKIIEINNLEHNKKALSKFGIGQRHLSNYIMAINDKFSNEQHLYFTDSQGDLLDYFKNYDEKILHDLYDFVIYKYRINNCCWVKKDEFIQSLQPKVLVLSNLRFMRQPHPCKPGACTCCCRKKLNLGQPSTSSNQKSSEADIIRDLENEIDINIININRTLKVNSKEWLNNLLTLKPTKCDPDSLIGKALIYNKPPLARLVDNRRLVTLKKGCSKHTVFVFRYFVEDLMVTYEINEEGQIETCLKSACFSNTEQPDVKRLLRKWNATYVSVCCWYKSEERLETISTCNQVHPSALKFIRTAHTCPSTECKCCCKPKVKTGIQLENIKLPKRSLFDISTLNTWGRASVAAKVDDDCQITSIIRSPSMQPVVSNTTIPATAVPPSFFVSDAVNNDELSKEVNTLITSILDRFKDVRLTINSEGKVAAALNTPVNTLSTVELKVLANILSFAQTQVNMLGSKVNSGASLSLSNIINLKVDDVQSNTTIDPNIIFKEFAKNTNVSIAHAPPPQPKNINMNTPLCLPQAPTAPPAYNGFTNSMSAQKQQFNDAFSSFINSKINDTFTPVIENVYSLKETDKTKDYSSYTTVWYREPSAQANSSSKVQTGTCVKKRKVVINPTEYNSKKIKLRSPTQLSAETANSSTQQNPVSLPAVYVLPQNNFMVPQTVNSTPAQPMLIINPLQNTGGTLIPISNQTGNIQSNVPIIINSASMTPQNSVSTSQLINTDCGNYIKVEKNISTQGTEPESIQFTESQDLLNDPEIDNISETLCVIEDEGQKADSDDTDSEVEYKYSPETNEAEEEDCILGF